ncbi:MAG: CCA tRNA nucleotidyltransferase [Euryarchaeota archaeon]|nr:CCA tRNA nucleotidyltransferase [Euryarchaeota archaeon]|tara:strand:- start:29988 stop:31337 length:1350 start_codon:yes stop_codon:yes gene_type:complete
MEKLLKEVLKRVNPSKEEIDAISEFTKKVLKTAKSLGVEATVQGSIAKDTWVSGTHDLDVFICFNEDVPRSRLEKDGISFGKKIIKELGGKPELVYAEHPYTKSTIAGFVLDIVPCYKLESASKIKSAVDRTPFHTEYILKNFSGKQTSEVRLLKRFMKGIGVYGAKEKVRGFSGYLCELLILEYGSFLDLISAAGKWKVGQSLDKEKFGTAKNFDDSLIVIDPTDKNRNVAAALDKDKYEIFIKASREFQRKHKIEFFFPNEVKSFSKESLKKELSKRGHLAILEFKPPKVVEDILYSQLRKSAHTIVAFMKRAHFPVLGYSYTSGDFSHILLDLEIASLPDKQKVDGPPTDVDQKFQDEFAKKHKKNKTWISGGRWHVEIDRVHRTPESLLNEIIKSPKDYGIGKYVAESLSKECKLLSSAEILDSDSEELAKFITSYLSKKKPWEW